MCRFISIFFLTLLLAVQAYAEPHLESERPYRGNPVAEQIHDQCEHLSHTKPSVTSTTTDLLSLRLERFYAARGFQPLWTSGKMFDELLASVEAASADGLTPSDYHITRLKAFVANPPLTPEQQAQADLLFTKSFLTLASHLRYGKVNPARLDPQWNISADRNLFALDEHLRQAITVAPVSAVLQGLPPQDSTYADLKKGLALYRLIARQGGWQPLPAGPPMKLGERDSRIALLRQRLQVSGDLPAAPSADTARVYTADIAAAVKRFQKRNALSLDGAVGTTTLRMMNMSVEQRIDQIRVNLERHRWFIHDLKPTSIVVNVPNYTLQYIENGRIRWMTKVIVGQPKRPTPIFKANMQYIVFNPKWVVPATILAKDVLPELHKSNTYLRKKQLRVVDQEGSTINPDSVDWSSYSASTLPYRLQQRSGDKGALGRIKFMMPNRHTVYLHDTGSKELFSNTRRALSSGCIRVQYPAELARLVLQDSVLWSTTKIQESIKSGKTRNVTLPKQIPVFLLYVTAIPNGAEIQFREDIYNRDNKVLKALDAR